MNLFSGVVLGLLTRYGFAEHSREHLTANHTIENGTLIDKEDAGRAEDRDTEAVESHNSTDLTHEYHEAVERFRENPNDYCTFSILILTK